MKNKNDFLIYIDECFCPDFQFKKNELYKCNIKILKLYDDDGNEYDYESIYTHDAELKYCEPCYNYNDLDLNINNTNNNMDEVNIKNDSEHYISENNNTNLENTLNTNFYNNNNMSSENDLMNSNFENKISSNIIMFKARQRNSKYLNGLVNKISKKIKNEETTTQAKNK